MINARWLWFGFGVLIVALSCAVLNWNAYHSAAMAAGIAGLIVGIGVIFGAAVSCLP